MELYIYHILGNTATHDEFYTNPATIASYRMSFRIAHSAALADQDNRALCNGHCESLRELLHRVRLGARERGTLLWRQSASGTRLRPWFGDAHEVVSVSVRFCSQLVSFPRGLSTSGR